MAINTLVPSIRVCTSNQCGTIKVYDTTGAYDLTSNEGGWGATNILTTDIDVATIVYTPPGGTATTVDVLTAVNDEGAVTGEFLIAEIAITPTDGEYSFVYTLTDVATSVTATLDIYSLCVVRCCVDKLWAKAAKELVDSDCGCTGSGTSYSKRAMQAEALYQAIGKSAACANEITRDALLLKLQRICNLENCNCG